MGLKVWENSPGMTINWQIPVLPTPMTRRCSLNIVGLGDYLESTSIYSTVAPLVVYAG